MSPAGTAALVQERPLRSPLLSKHQASLTRTRRRVKTGRRCETVWLRSGGWGTAADESECVHRHAVVDTRSCRFLPTSRAAGRGRRTHRRSPRGRLVDRSPTGSTSRPTTASASPERSPATAGGTGTDVRGDRPGRSPQVALERHHAAPSCGRGRRAMADAPSAPAEAWREGHERLEAAPATVGARRSSPTSRPSHLTSRLPPVCEVVVTVRSGTGRRTT